MVQTIYREHKVTLAKHKQNRGEVSKCRFHVGMKSRVPEMSFSALCWKDLTESWSYKTHKKF